MDRKIGTWVTIGHPIVAELVASQDFDFITIDIEHSAMDFETVFSMIQVISLKNKQVLVRVTENNPAIIKRIMDAGAHGVIVPMVNTKEEAQRAVSAVKYPPFGNRGIGLSRAQGYGYGFERYKEWLKAESKVIVQIEHIEGIRNLEEILSVDGIDGTLIGPYDLSGSLGIPGEFEDKSVQDALATYEKISKEKAIPMGYHVVQPDHEKINSLIERGYIYIAVGLDTLFLGDAIQSTLRTIKSGGQV